MTDLRVIGTIRSTLRDLETAPRQGSEGAPDAWLEVDPAYAPDRPNPIGLHHVTVREIAGTRLRVGPIEAIDGTPVVDIKPVA